MQKKFFFPSFIALFGNFCKDVQKTKIYFSLFFCFPIFTSKIFSLSYNFPFLLWIYLLYIWIYYFRKYLYDFSFYEFLTCLLSLFITSKAFTGSSISEFLLKNASFFYFNIHTYYFPCKNIEKQLFRKKKAGKKSCHIVTRYIVLQ